MENYLEIKAKSAMSLQVARTLRCKSFPPCTHFIAVCSCEGSNNTRVECSPGTFNNESNSVDVTACESCPTGYYSGAGAASCTMCPAGYACPTGLIGKNLTKLT